MGVWRRRRFPIRRKRAGTLATQASINRTEQYRSEGSPAGVGPRFMFAVSPRAALAVVIVGVAFNSLRACGEFSEAFG
jgi:hypothetical protein